MHNYCEENGTFCPFFDERSGLCIATTCKLGTDILTQIEIDRQALAAKEAEEGKIAMREERLARAMEQIAACIDPDIDEEILKELHRYNKIQTEED